MQQLNPASRPTLWQRIRAKWYGLLLAYVGRCAYAPVDEELRCWTVNRLETVYLIAVEPDGTLWVQYPDRCIVHMKLLPDGRLHEVGQWAESQGKTVRSRN